jgi:hypothetical protein
MKKTLGFRRTPWDDAMRSRYIPQAEPQQAAAHCEFCLQGRWFVDPRIVTPEHARQFMWEGLRTFRAEASAKGMPDYRIDQIVQVLFGQFHDAATDIYRVLKLVENAPACQPVRWCSLPHHGGHAWTEYDPSCFYRAALLVEAEIAEKEKPVREDVFVACEEDRPVPVTVRFRKMEPLLDPDANLLESAES